MDGKQKNKKAPAPEPQHQSKLGAGQASSVRGAAKKQESKLEECQKQRDEYLAGWQRAKADFLNYKKEEAERMQALLKYAGEEAIFKILPILDNFELVAKNLPEGLKDSEYIKGILQIKIQLQDFLKNQGIEEIKTVGERFNPNLHEAVEEVEAKDKEAGIIVEEAQKGYKLHGKVIRPARVKVTK